MRKYLTYGLAIILIVLSILWAKDIIGAERKFTFTITANLTLKQASEVEKLINQFDEKALIGFVEGVDSVEFKDNEIILGPYKPFKYNFDGTDSSSTLWRNIIIPNNTFPCGGDTSFGKELVFPSFNHVPKYQM